MKCSICGKELSKKDTKFRYDNGEWICQDCMRNKCSYCYECGSYHLRWNTCSCQINNYSGKRVLSYGTKPPLKFFSKKNRQLPRYYGMEFEMSNINPSLLKRIFAYQYAEGMMYNKADGSLHSGVEVVTQPMDREFMDDFITGLADGIDSIKENCSDTSRNAGIHIHINRNLPKEVEHKLHLLFNYCFDIRNIPYLALLVGRRKSLTTRNNNMGYCTCGMGNMKEQAGRHEAVNFKNESTIEFRMFKSTLDINQIKSYFDIVDLSIEFCCKTPISFVNINNFLLYIKKNSNNKVLLKKIKTIEKFRAVELSVVKNDLGVPLKFRTMTTEELKRAIIYHPFKDREKAKLLLKQQLIKDILELQKEVEQCV